MGHVLSVQAARYAASCLSSRGYRNSGVCMIVFSFVQMRGKLMSEAAGRMMTPDDDLVGSFEGRNRCGKRKVEWKKCKHSL